MSAANFFGLLGALEELKEQITDLCNGDCADLEVDTRMSDTDFTVIQRAAEFGIASTAIYELLAEQTWFCKLETHNAALHLCGFRSLEISLLFPLCRRTEKWHPAMATIRSLDARSQPQIGGEKLDNICTFVHNSSIRRTAA